MIEVIEADALRLRILLTQPLELVRVGRTQVPVAVDELDEAATNALDGRNSERLVVALIGLGSEGDGMAKGMTGIDHAPGHGWRARSMLLDESHAEGIGFGIEDVVDI